VTGRLVAADRPDAVREKFLAGLLPEPERPEDYDAAGRVRLPPEYAVWLAEGGAGLARSLVAGSVASPPQAGRPPMAAAIRLQQPLPASVYVLDPDLPDAGGWLPLRAQGAGELTWSSPTLAIAIRDGRPCARLSEGRHELEASDRATGAAVRTWIEVRRL